MYASWPSPATATTASPSWTATATAPSWKQEAWLWDDGRWTPGSSSGTGRSTPSAPSRPAARYGDASYAFGRAPGRPSVTISFDGQTFEVPVGPHGVWAFIKAGTGPAPTLTT